MKYKVLGEKNREEVLQMLNNNLPKKRYQHILGVEEMALALAEHHGGNLDQCGTAALFHDYAKYMDLEESLRILKENNYLPDATEAESTELLHSKVMAYIAKNQFGVLDQDTLNGISFHTTGRENMSLTEKILFIADAIEKNRSYPGVEDLRKEAFHDLDNALLAIIDEQIVYLINKRKKIHANSIFARNFILSNLR